MRRPSSVSLPAIAEYPYSEKERQRSGLFLADPDLERGVVGHLFAGCVDDALYANTTMPSVMNTMMSAIPRIAMVSMAMSFS